MANPGWTAILDDGEARKCARAFSVPVKGTLAVVLLAKQRGLISSAARVLQQLLDIGFRLDEHIVRDALEQTLNETWPAL
jgi:predicted nucleic acid-binding protein